eukprot:8112482-Alexandrium_andersonii.AAC.1
MVHRGGPQPPHLVYVIGGLSLHKRLVHMRKSNAGTGLQLLLRRFRLYLRGLSAVSRSNQHP